MREAGSAYILSVEALGRVRGIFRETKTTLNLTERPFFTQDHLSEKPFNLQSEYDTQNREELWRKSLAYGGLTDS